MMMDLNTIPALVTQTNQTAIMDNTAAVKEALDEFAKSVTMPDRVTEETYKAAKATRAQLNKMLAQFDTRCESVKKDAAVPYAEFEARYNDMVSSLKGLQANVDSLIKQYEEQLVNDKNEQIKELIDEALGKRIDDPNYDELCRFSELPWFRFKNWTNQTYTVSNIQKDIDAQLSDIQSALAHIAKNEKHKAQLYARFKQYGSLADLLNYDTQLDQQEKEAETLRSYAPAPKPEPEPPKAQEIAADDPVYTIPITKPANEKQKTVVDYTFVLTAPAYVCKSIADELTKRGCTVKTVSVKAHKEEKK